MIKHTRQGNRTIVHGGGASWKAPVVDGHDDDDDYDGDG